MKQLDLSEELDDYDGGIASAEDEDNAGETRSTSVSMVPRSR